ncbi:hypothetical protein Tco_1048888, partial [Tanacetum coccineum]
IMEMDPYIENMTLNEYLEYETEKERQLWFFTQQPNTPNTPVDKKDSDFDEILDDLFSVGAENLRRMGQEKVRHGCNVDTSKDTNHESGNLLNFPIFLAANEFSSICEQDVDLEKEEAEVEDDDDGDTYDIWDITIEDVEQIRQFLMPNFPDKMDNVIQPLIPQTIHTTPPNDDYVALATKSILDELLEEFDKEIMNVTMVDKETAKDPQSHFMEIKVHSVITKLEPFIYTRPLSPLCGVIKTSKPCEVSRNRAKFEITSTHNHMVKLLLMRQL